MADWEMIKRDELIKRLQSEKSREHALRLEIVDKIIASDDPKQIQELKDINVVHTAVIHTIDAIIKIVSEMPAMRLINME